MTNTALPLQYNAYVFAFSRPFTYAIRSPRRLVWCGRLQAGKVSRRVLGTTIPVAFPFFRADTKFEKFTSCVGHEQYSVILHGNDSIDVEYQLVPDTHQVFSDIFLHIPQRPGLFWQVESA